MKKYTIFYYYMFIENERLVDYEYIYAENLEKTKEQAKQYYDDAFFIAKGHVQNLLFKD